MLRHYLTLFFLISSTLAGEIQQAAPACRIKLPADHQSDVLLNNLKWQEPKKLPSGNNLQLECSSGFLQKELDGKKVEQFVCNSKSGLYNGTYKYDDLLCRSDFHKLDRVTKVPANQLGSSILSCTAKGLEVYHVGRDTAVGEKILYHVCLDTNTMRPKFSFQPSSSTKPVVRFHSREEDVWGFDGYGQTAEDRKRLSQGYVKVLQQKRVTQAFSDRYNQGKQYPYYFNRGHLVPYTNFANHDDQKVTVQYINAAPQWDVLNKEAWSLIEREAREILQNNPQDWEIYTGPYGTIQSPRGLVNLVPTFDAKGKFVKGFLPVPQLFWKIVHNKKDKTKSRVFIGVNNPEYRTTASIPDTYRLCQTTIKGTEFSGFTYECPLGEFLVKLKSKENIVI